MLPTTTRQCAKAIGALRYFTGTKCKRGHIAERQVSNKTCLVCGAIQATKRSEVSKAKDVIRKHLWYLAHKETLNQRGREYHKTNLAKMRAANLAYRLTHKEDQERRRSAHFVANRHRYYAAIRKRTFLQKQAMPKWADHELIVAFYAEALRLTKETGIKHHVDHFVPINSRLVCGLHVHDNLRVITAAKNMQKHNRWPVDECVF